MPRQHINDIELSHELTGDGDDTLVRVDEGSTAIVAEVSGSPQPGDLPPCGRHAMTTRQDGGTRAQEQVGRPEFALSIRALAEQDHQAIHEILISRSVIEGTMRLPHAATRGTIERLAPRPGTVHLVAAVDGRAVGVLELVTWPDEPRHRHVGEVNLVAVHPDWAGRGVGRALMEAAVELADDWLNLRRLSLVVFVDNVVAVEMYRRLGFVVEGTMVGYGFKRGKYIDAHVMARLNSAVPSSGLPTRDVPARL